MPELREVKLTQIRPNPFRDIENYPFWRDKLDRLKESMRSTGAWPNIIVREDPKEARYFQLAFGHHRLKAMEELGLSKAVIIIETLDDDAMLRMMCDENAEEFGTNFMLGTMNAVSATRKYLEANHVGDHRISANDVGRFLGWTTADETAKGGLQASQKVWIAFRALDLIDLGVCKANVFQGLGHEQAAQVVRQAELIYKSRMRELEKDAEDKEKRRATTEARKQAGAAVAKAVGAIKDGVGVRELKEQTKVIRSEVQAVATQKPKSASEIDISRLVDKATDQLTQWMESHDKMFALYARGAICDRTAWNKLAKVVDRITKVMDKALERRDE